MKLQLRSKLSNDAADALSGTRLRRGQLSVLLTGDADVYKPDGTPLLMLRAGAIPPTVCAAAYPALHHIGQSYLSDNRGAYAGLQRGKRLREDGTVSKSSRTMDERGVQVSVASAVVGYFDRQGGWLPFCRATAFTGREPEKWITLLPMISCVAEVYAKTAPTRYQAQMNVAEQVHPDWIIKGTPFSTLTVNNNVLGAIHKDKGDCKAGLGVISVVSRGTYAGAVLGFPEYGVGVELFDGDVLLFNAHEWHGVTEFEGTLSEDHERISIVYYLREKMVACGSATEELVRAKERSGVGLIRPEPGLEVDV